MSQTRKTWLWSITEYGFGISPLRHLRAWVFVVVVLLLMAGSVAGAAAASRATCANRAVIMELDYEWRFFGGCLVQFDGTWVPMDRYLGLEEVGR